MRLAVLLALAGCYEAPASDPACTILCDATCPGDMACVHGYCVGPGDTCTPSFASVRAGNGFACALDGEKRRWCWGANDHHQLSSSDETQIVYATRFDNGPWDSLATGGDHVCGLRGGELYCWGGNDHQQVTGTVIGDVSTPMRIASPSGVPWTFVAAGYNATCAIADRLYCWGAGDGGQLGTGSMGDVGVPTPIAGDVTDWTMVSLGHNHSCAISRALGLHCWGSNEFGQVGDGSPLASGMPVMSPTPIALPGAMSVAVAADSTCAVADGSLYCWGNQANSALGDPALTNICDGPRNAPALSSGLTGWTTLSASQNMTCGLRADEVWCWGYSVGGGGLGKGVWSNTGWGRVTQGASDVTVGWNANIDEAGDTVDVDLACALIDGHVQCWGDNRYGQLAQGDATMHPTPKEIAGNHRWKSLIAADQHTCGITTDDDLYCWGTMLSGQTIGTVIGTSAVPCGSLPDVPCTLGEPTAVPFQPQADALSLGDNHTCALRGTMVTCWGSNNNGQLTGLTSPATIPGTWDGLYHTGAFGTCGVQSGQTWCWGAVTGSAVALTADPRLDGSKQIFTNALIGDYAQRSNSSRAMGCSLGPDDQLSCFGANNQGQFGSGKPDASCGNFQCEVGEDATSCPDDCPGTLRTNTDDCGVQRTFTSYARCGDGVCTAGYGETCSSCAGDCGACPFTALGRTYSTFAIGMSSTSSFVCAVRPDGKVECWGKNQAGQVGLTDDTTGAPVDPVYTPTVVGGLPECVAVAASDTTSCALCGGSIYCWGSNRRGAIGAGAVTALPIPVPRKVDVELAVGDKFVQLTAGTGYVCARTESGRGFCWGFHRYGALGTGSTSKNLPVDIVLAPPAPSP